MFENNLSNISATIALLQDKIKAPEKNPSAPRAKRASNYSSKASIDPSDVVRLAALSGCFVRYARSTRIKRSSALPSPAQILEAAISLRNIPGVRPFLENTINLLSLGGM